ncbi:hypothetical protein ACTFRP_29030 [Bacillus cereus group sp. MYBK234-1]|uniref:hypothetical protein n=1 Tax=unclassified Bacillus cereus group TaxID=2750818 RepID=UPI003F79D68D
MKQFNKKLTIKKLTGLALASAIGFNSFGALETNVYAAEHTHDRATSQTIKTEDMSLKQLQDALQYKHYPYLNNIKLFIDRHFNELEILWQTASEPFITPWQTASEPLKTALVNFLLGDLGDEKKYYKGMYDIMASHDLEFYVIINKANNKATLSEAFKLDLSKLITGLADKNL